MIGHSEITQQKQEYLSRFLDRHILIAEKTIAKNSNWCRPEYYYFDLNAGDGTGSVSIFLEKASRKTHMKFKILACEIEEDAREKLHDVMKKSPANVVYTIADDNREITRGHLKNAYGLIYHDPNGIFDCDLMKRLSNELPRLDLLINVNATAIKRCLSAFDYPSLKSRISTIKKENWIVRECLGKWQWSFLFGSNWKAIKSFEMDEFYCVDSEIGKNLLQKLDCISKMQVQDFIPKQLEFCFD